MYYRGCLDFCNYSCDYCPFSKKKYRQYRLSKDKEQLKRYVSRIRQLGLQGAVLLIPYGEAMVHSYYWEALAQMSKNPHIDAVGIQSNFSFPMPEFVGDLKKHGANFKKIHLWGTFHPQMTTMEAFLEQCKKLTAYEVSYSVGMVAIPEKIEEVEEFRKALPREIYLWLNALDGAKRPYTEGELRRLLVVDPYFKREVTVLPSQVTDCPDTYFVRGDGSMYACPVSHKCIGNLYDTKLSSNDLYMHIRRECSRKYCDCYLAYNNRLVEKIEEFGEYSAFRNLSYY